MTSTIATMRISRQLSICETGADRLLADTARLAAEMASARADCGAKTGTGQRAIQRVIEAQRSLVDAQAGLIRVHADLLKIGQERGDILDGECPPRVAALEAAA